MSIEGVLLFVHIIAGGIALIMGIIATGARFFKAPHKVHKISGQIFFWGMFVIFLTACWLSLLTHNLFLFLIGIFSFYLALSGYCFAKNRTGSPQKLDWIRVGIMFLTGIIMLLYGIFLFLTKEENGITMFVFASIGVALSVTDYRYLLSGDIRGAKRISRHLTMMLAACIATITAFVVVNFELEPVWLLWLLPTIIVTPVIIFWNRKVLKENT